MPGYQNQDQNQNQNQNQNQIFLIKIEFLIYKKITNNAGRKSQHESDYQNLEVCTEKLEKCFERNSESHR
jgi:hypothetical protein